MTVRQATPRDLALVIMLHNKYNNFLGYFSRVAAARMISLGQVYISYDNGQPCGYVAFRTRLKTDPRVTAIYQAAVHWDVLLNGHGRDLLTAVASISRADGCEIVQLWCRAGDPGHRFWPACGMTAVASRCGKETARGRDCYLWRLPVTHTAVDTLNSVLLPRKPVTPSGKWARLDEPDTHAVISRLRISADAYARCHFQIDRGLFDRGFDVPADPHALRSVSK
jgi:hypothetical protein